jgi:hypothetical protein
MKWTLIVIYIKKIIRLYDFLMGNNNYKKNHQVQLKINNVYLKIKKMVYIHIY